MVLNTVPDSSFKLTVGKIGIGNSLFMFEFRDPSMALDVPLQPTAIPEPTFSLMALCGFSLLAFCRVRSR